MQAVSCKDQLNADITAQRQHAGKEASTATPSSSTNLTPNPENPGPYLAQHTHPTAPSLQHPPPPTATSPHPNQAKNAT